MYKMKSIFSTFVLLLMFINTKAQFSGSGSGTETDPYQVANATQLDEIRNYLGSANSIKHFSISNDIDLAELIATKYPTDGWEPIGNKNDGDTNAFYGSLNGNGFKITNLWINRVESNYLGLFGNTQEAFINNLNIELASNGIKGGDYVGALSGSTSGGAITNVKMTGSITALNYVGGLIGENGSPITACQSSGDVTVEGDYVGGLIGKTTAAVSDCSSSSNVENTGGVFVGNFMGGLVGVNQAVVTNSHASGGVTGTSTIGGLVGDSYAPVNNSFATGNISGMMWVGGLVGTSDAVDNSYATGTVYSDQKIAGGLVGQSYGTITGSHATGNIRGSQSLGGLVGILGAAVSYSYATGNVTQIVAENVPEGGFIDIGGLAGSSFSNGIIDNCFAAGDVKVTDNTAQYVGGLIGLSNGISNSYAYGSVTGGYSLVGGLAGTTWAPIVNSAALNPWITSSPTGNLNKIHRLVGDVEFDTEITNSYALDSMLVNGEVVTDGTDNFWSGADKSLEDLQKQLTYGTGLTWDFETIWKIREGHGYPYLQNSEYLTSIIQANTNNKDWGTITPVGTVAINDTTAQTFEITPITGYEIESLMIDDVSTEATSSYTFDNVTENHSITAIFRKIELGTNETGLKEINVYPNPTSDYIYISGNKKINTLELYNVNGQKVMQNKGNKMDISLVTKGVYILKTLTDNNEVFTNKIIKK